MIGQQSCPVSPMLYFCSVKARRRQTLLQSLSAPSVLGARTAASGSLRTTVPQEHRVTQLFSFFIFLLKASSKKTEV